MAQASSRAVRSAPLVLIGVGVIVVGVAVTLLGLGGVSAFDISVKSFAFDSTSSGLAVVALGGGLMAGLTLDGTEDRHVAGSGVGGSALAAERRVASAGTWVMGLGLILYVTSILF